MPTFPNRLRHAWNAFFGRDAPEIIPGQEPSYPVRPDRTKLSRGVDRSVLSSIYNRIAMDVAATPIRHIRTDGKGQYVETIPSGLNYCLNTEANIDQTARAFIQDLVLSLFDEGVVAAVPVDTDLDPEVTGSFDIRTLRVGKIVEWKPQSVKVNLYNDRIGRKEEIWLPKSITGIVENPLYSVMNEPNSTFQRLISKFAMLDTVDEMTSSGKMNIIIQLPYAVKSPLRQKQAEQRRKDLEEQLAGSKYGVAYIDGTEHITQLNRALENNLLSQIEFLTKQLYSQLGLAEGVFNGSADEAAMINYYNCSVEPVLSAITGEFSRKFLTKTARTQHQVIRHFRDPFRMCSVSNLADSADKFTRNEILSTNEFRSIIGYAPSNSNRANELINKNMPIANQEGAEVPSMGPEANAETNGGDIHV